MHSKEFKFKDIHIFQNNKGTYEGKIIGTSEEEELVINFPNMNAPYCYINFDEELKDDKYFKIYELRINAKLILDEKGIAGNATVVNKKVDKDVLKEVILRIKYNI